MKILFVAVLLLVIAPLAHAQTGSEEKFPTFTQVKAGKETLSANLLAYEKAQKKAAAAYSAVLRALKNSRASHSTNQNLKIEFLKAQARSMEKGLAVIETLMHFKMVQARQNEAISKGWRIEEIGEVVLWDEKLGEKCQKKYDALTKKDIPQESVRRLMAAK